MVFAEAKEAESCGDHATTLRWPQRERTGRWRMHGRCPEAWKGRVDPVTTL